MHAALLDANVSFALELSALGDAELTDPPLALPPMSETLPGLPARHPRELRVAWLFACGEGIPADHCQRAHAFSGSARRSTGME
mmetsp:Transcript_100060/g.188369  ORF Transcript_100060/g.188369 Transcript_100060/m.188369 type:complete len:84 (-) Transcript_100060:42-293(-)